MHKITFVCLATVIAAAQPAAAQVACPNIPVERRGPPVLDLLESATVKVGPSLLVADLTAGAHAATAVPMQRAVNTLMDRARALAEETSGVAVIFQNDSTQYVDAEAHRPAHWIASQTLELRGRSGEAVLDLVGRLQGIGLTIDDLEWQVPAEQVEAARRKATIKALTALRNETNAAAGALGLAVGGYRSIDLAGGPCPVPMGSGRVLGLAIAAAMRAPQASAASQDITATACASVILEPMPSTHPTVHR